MLTKNFKIETLYSSSKPNATTQCKQVSNEETQYCFDNMFGEDINSLLIYNDVIKDIVSSVAKDGINVTICTYGQTSPDKTFTMQGNCHDGIGGITQFAATDIFEMIKQSCESSLESVMKESYVEIYNEEL